MIYLEEGIYLSVQEVALHVGKCNKTIRRHIWKGKIQAYRIGRGDYLIFKDQFPKYKDQFKN